MYNKRMQDEQQPGWTFTPGQQPVQSPAAPQTAGPASPVPAVPPPSPQAPAPAAPPQPSPQASTDNGINWTASEFVEHEKSAGWYLGVLFVAAVGIGIIYFITKDVFSVVVLAMFAIGFVVLAARKPQVLSYSLSDNGIQVGQKFYTFGQFKSFAVIDEGMIHSITLLPLKRFMPGISVYYAPDDEAAIVNFLGAHLPHEERKQDAVDRFMHRIRF